ncbi:sulfurtransferase [Amycolatopsis sp. CA-126428]|uniref:sulfurtransferase n=1 Tax=Amycolatopsis sp. CA-126428 TaxID=2073158 RepID=UPI000CCFD682|nr:sulfurtransferase [Amycolatopsis sp. CA-126428]
MEEPVVGLDRIRRDDVTLVDVRWYLDGRSGAAAYEAGHLPGAVWVDLDTVLSGPPDPAGGRHPIPTPEAFAEGLGRAGVADDATVIAYDDNGGAYAARLVWLLRLLGRPAALLDGGLQAWPGELERGVVTRPPVTRRVAGWPAGAFHTADEAARAPVLLDARAPERYSGESVLPSDVRSGHIPGAVNAPWAANLDEDNTFASRERLREHYGALGVTGDSDVTVYCGSGVTACHDLLALELIGVRAALYPGSWSAWSAEPARPISTGNQPR